MPLCCPMCFCHNKAGKKFVDITASSGTGELHKGHGVAFADIDNDGDEDIILEVAVGGSRRHPRAPLISKTRDTATIGLACDW